MPSASNLVDFVVIISGLAVCLKKFVVMECFRELRVILRTLFFSFIVIIYFLMYAVTLVLITTGRVW